MRCYLFIEMHPSGRAWSIRPVPWAAPDIMDAITIPDALPPKREYLQWLLKNGLPIYRAGWKGSQNMKQLARDLGEWVEPIDVPVESSTDYKFNDDLKALTGF